MHKKHNFEDFNAFLNFPLHTSDMHLYLTSNAYTCNTLHSTFGDHLLFAGL